MEQARLIYGGRIPRVGANKLAQQFKGRQPEVDPWDPHEGGRTESTSEVVF